MMSWTSLLRRILSRTTSQLDEVIQPEIRDDAFSAAIERVAATPGVRDILEIGSSSGEGSTAAFVAGMARNPETPTLHCMEVSRPRFVELEKRYASHPAVRCYNLSSVAVDRFPTREEVAEFHANVDSPLREYPLDTVLGWLDQDIRYLKEHEMASEGIRKIREMNGIDHFDAVLIDGSEFTGMAELDEVYGARYLLLDDVRTFKNYRNWRKLAESSDYSLVEEHPDLRNGFAIFERIPSA